MLKRSLREEGPTFLFKGWTPAFIRLGPNTVLMFVFFEVCTLLTLGMDAFMTVRGICSNSKLAGERYSLPHKFRSHCQTDNASTCPRISVEALELTALEVQYA